MKLIIKKYILLLILTGIAIVIAYLLQPKEKTPVSPSVSCAVVGALPALKEEKPKDIALIVEGKKETFENGQPFKKEEKHEEKWSVGVASAYGGWSDAQIDSNARTATGDSVTENSLGVAIPVSWKRSDLYGHKVLIEYNGDVVEAVINDCGGMGGGSRSLDLQPGVFKSFGFDTCDSWGLRTVKYKIL